MKAGLQRGITVYNGWLTKYPLSTRAITTSLILSASDVIAQTCFNGSAAYDWKRSGRTAVIGLCVTGPSLYVWFNIGLPRIMGLKILASYSPLQKALVGTVIDQSCFGWWTVSNYLFWVNFLKHWDLHRAVDNLKWNIMPAMKMSWLYWPTIIFCNLNFVPLLYRVFTINIASIFWNFFLSYRNQKGLEQRSMNDAAVRHAAEQTTAASQAA